MTELETSSREGAKLHMNKAGLLLAILLDKFIHTSRGIRTWDLRRTMYQLRDITQP